jgi:hypothetical protein
MHSGKIGAFSDGEGLGTTFFVEMPAFQKSTSSTDIESLVDNINSPSFSKFDKRFPGKDKNTSSFTDMTNLQIIPSPEVFLF